MTNAGRAVEHASMQVMFPGHISLMFLTSALCLTKVEASTVSTKHKRTDLALADKVKVVNILDENKSHTEIATKLVIVL